MNVAQEEIIQVLIAVDCETVIATLGTNSDSNNPVQVQDSSLIWMITKQGDAVSGNAGNELTIKAETEDVIRWRETSLSLESDYVTLLYEFVNTSGDGDLISPPVPLLAKVKVPLPNPSAPLQPGMQEIESYFWQCTVLNPGSVTYHFKFMIVGRDGTVAGYYWWDPFIQIAD